MKFFDYFKKTCPCCKAGKLKFTNFIRATLNKNAHRVPSLWTYYQCNECGVKLKLFLDDSYEKVSDEEWEKYCRNERKV